MQIACTGYLVNPWLDARRDIQALVQTARYPAVANAFSTATFAASG